MKSNISEASSLDLNKLRTFFAIAESGGVSAAAERLALTRSAISHSLAGLEGELGVPLFHRIGKKLVLTRDGAVLRDAYGEIEEKLSGALSRIRDEDPEIRGWIRLGLFVGFSRFRLSALLMHFLDAYPLARVRVVYGSRSELANRLMAGKLDFGLALGGGPRVNAIRSTRLFDQQLVLACRDRPRGGAQFDAISRLAFVDFFQSDPLIDRWVAHHFGKRHRIDRQQIRVWAASNSDLALELACSGVAATVLPSNLIEPFRKRKELIVIRGPRTPLRDEIWLNELTSARMTRIQTAFKRALIDHLV